MSLHPFFKQEKKYRQFWQQSGNNLANYDLDK